MGCPNPGLKTIRPVPAMMYWTGSPNLGRIDLTVIREKQWKSVLRTGDKHITPSDVSRATEQGGEHP